jgi:hypothetical protein
VSLHWRKQLFVAEYVAHPELNATQVAERCGFTGAHVKTRAYEMLRDPEVKAAIEHAQREVLAKVEVTAEEVVRDILAARQRCVEAGDGAWQTQGRLKCDELLGKFLGMWQEKVEVSFAEALAERLKKARHHVAGSNIEEPEPKALPAPVEAELVAQEEEDEVSRPEANGIGLPQEEPEDWVERLL